MKRLFVSHDKVQIPREGHCSTGIEALLTCRFFGLAIFIDVIGSVGKRISSVACIDIP